MIDVSYFGVELAQRPSRQAILETHKLEVTNGSGGTVTVLDGGDMSDAELDTALNELTGQEARILVLFTLSRGTAFRDRRSTLLVHGATDVMDASSSDVEFLTRVRSLMHQARPPQILVIEDEAKIGDWVVRVLEKSGMTAVRAPDLTTAKTLFEAQPFDAMIVDRGLPDGDGLGFVAQLRDLGIRTPALMLTAMDDIQDRIAGLREARADDYICKPVHEDELVARVQVLLRPLISAEMLVFGPLEIGRKDRIVRWRGSRIDLRRKECEMLTYLAERAGLHIPQRMIYLDVWGKVFMDIGSNPVTAARHRMVRDVKAFLKVTGETYPEFVGTEGDSYVFLSDPLLRLPVDVAEVT